MKTESFSLGTPSIYSFFDPATNTITHIVVDDSTSKVAIIDSVLDYEPNAARITTTSADRLIQLIQEKGWEVEWIMETHAHADHLSAAHYLQKKLGGQIAIGEHITTVQNVFGDILNLGEEFKRDGSQFDKLLKDGEHFKLGSIEAYALYTPGHTPACMTYVIGDAAFVGDTLFMPDYGTARCDFPGGSADTLYGSIQKIFALPDETRLYMCHDYLPSGREEFLWETTVRLEKERNVHVGLGHAKDDFVQMRKTKDAGLGMPRLILPSIQVNIRGGRLPEPERNGVQYLKLPVNQL